MHPDIGASQRPMRNEAVCGDAFVVLRHEEITIAVADGAATISLDSWDYAIFVDPS